MKAKIIQPPFLKQGDLVAIISPSGVINEEVIPGAVRVIESWGLRVITGKNIFKSDGPFAGKDNERLEDLQWAVDNTAIKAVFCSRGGYGISKIVDKVNFGPLRKNPKWFVGFSDITVLHQWLLNVCGIMSLHGEMPLNYNNPEKSEKNLDTLRGVLFGEGYEYKWGVSNSSIKNVKGILTGGNLSLLYSLTGTPAGSDMRGKILFIEEVGEYYYHLDRMMTSLRLSGRIEGLVALLVGGISRMEEGRIPWGRSAESIISEVVSCYDYPVIFGFPAGHLPENLAFIIGKEARITTENGNFVLRYK